LPALEQLADGLVGNKSLTILTLAYNSLCRQTIVPLITLLTEAHVIQNINLNNNELDHYFAALFAKTFELNPQLNSLDLSNNNLGNLGLTMIARYIGHLESLSKLNLANNEATELGLYFVNEALKSFGKPDDFQI
jgi:Ran GTPase-activating protein (RanGAP) involved in mRNA processing and transport